MQALGLVTETAALTQGRRTPDATPSTPKQPEGTEMKTYTFETEAIVTVEAESEDSAYKAFVRSCYEQDEDIDYNGLSVYLPSYGSAKLVNTETIA